MGNYRKLFALLFVSVAVLLLLWMFFAERDFFTFSYLKVHHQALRAYIKVHETKAAVFFVLLYMSTALAVPGAIVLTVAAGALFGTLPGICLVNIGSTLGAAAAFLITRYLLGDLLQGRYYRSLLRFNRELELHGSQYLIILRIIPAVPAFVVNYLAGLTRIPFGTFLWTTSVGVLPGSFVYAFAGRQLGALEHPEDILRWPILLALVLLSVFILLPVLLRHGRRIRR